MMNKSAMMMRTNRKIAAIMAISLLAGCAGQPSPMTMQTLGAMQAQCNAGDPNACSAIPGLQQQAAYEAQWNAQQNTYAAVATGVMAALLGAAVGVAASGGGYHGGYGGYHGGWHGNGGWHH